MRIALTFLTCDRVDYTRRTLETLAAHNDLSRFVLLHGDDASVDDAGGELARRLGFETVVQTKALRQRGRRGVAAMTEELFEHASRRGCELVLNLQNDWECVRPIPPEVWQFFVHPSIYCVRLYGAMKSTTGRCGIHHGGREPRKVVEWRPFEPNGGRPKHATGWEIGDIHWGHPPAVTRIRQAVSLTRDAVSEKISRVRSGKIYLQTVRPVENVFLHIGRERTPGFVA